MAVKETDRGRDAPPFVVEHYADFGTSEPWVSRLMLGLREIVFVVPAFANSREDFMLEVGEVFEVLGMAFEKLRTLRRYATEDASVIDTTGAYEALYGHLWRAHHDRFPTAMSVLGLDIGSLYANDQKFETRAMRLLARRPKLADLVDLMRRDRAEFQSRFADYRNKYLEHRKGRASLELRDEFHLLASAELTFDNVWQAIEDYVVLFAKVSMPPGFHVIEIPDEERDPTRPTRFRLAIEGV